MDSFPARLFSLSNAFKNGMTRLNSTIHNEADILQGKDFIQNKSHLKSVLKLPTIQLPRNNHSTPENCIPMGLSVQSSLNIFHCTDRQTHQTFTKMNQISAIFGYWWTFYASLLLPFNSPSELALLIHSVSFRMQPRV